MKYKNMGQICDVITDYVANGSFASLKENVEYLDKGYATVIRLTDYRNNFKGPFQYVSKSAYEYLSKTKLFGGEVIISNVGANVGTVFKVPYLNTPMTLGPNAILIKTKYDTNYLFYFLKSRLGQYLLKSICSGSAQPKFNKTDFKTLVMPFPDLNIQNSIANKLTIIDDKIKLNNQINDNLIELIDNIYTNFCQKNPAVKQIQLQQKFSIHSKTFKVDKSKEKLVWHFSLPNFDDNKEPKLEKISTIKSNKKYVPNNTVLFSKLNPKFKRVWSPDNNCYAKFSKICSPEFLTVTGKNFREQALLFAIINNGNFFNFLNENATGTTGSRQRVKPQIAYSYELPFDVTQSDKIEDLLSPLLIKIQKNHQENVTLTKIKNILLTKYF